MMRLVLTLFLLPLVVRAAPDLPKTVVTPSPVTPDVPAVAEAPPASVAPMDEKAIPDAFPVARYEASWNKNPFLLKTAAIAQIQESWAKDYVLTSLAEIDGVFRASIKNKVTGESKRLVQGKEGDSEFKIVTVNLQPNKKESSVQIAKGSETADLKYDETQMTAQGRPAQGQPTAARAGMPVLPGQAAAMTNGSRTVAGTAAGGGIPGRATGAPGTARSAGYPPNGTANPSTPQAGYANSLPPLPAIPNSQSMAPPPVPRSYSGTSAPNSATINKVPTATGTVPSLNLSNGSVPLPASTATETNPLDPATGNNPNAPSPVTRRRTLIPAPVLPQ
jgi:hypothetical protein